jgi:putative hydrolase of HD superfamily
MKQKKKLNRDLEFLYEIGCLRFLRRNWQRFLNPDFANLAEHPFRVAWLSLILAKMEGVKNTDKILKMALVHDVGESRAGDVDYLQRQYVKRHEKMGIEDIFRQTSLEEELPVLWEECENPTSLEAKIVKDADNLDVDLELKEQEERGFSIRQKLQDIRRHVAKEKLYTQSAKILWEEIQESDPHDWHFRARNRFNSGDWKKSEETS